MESGHQPSLTVNRQIGTGSLSGSSSGTGKSWQRVGSEVQSQEAGLWSKVQDRVGNTDEQQA